MATRILRTRDGGHYEIETIYSRPSGPIVWREDGWNCECTASDVLTDVMNGSLYAEGSRWNRELSQLRATIDHSLEIVGSISHGTVRAEAATNCLHALRTQLDELWPGAL
jgi:hypothetical protein